MPGKPLTFGHHRQCQGQDPRHGFLPVSPVPAANPHLRTPSTTSRTRSTRILACLCGKPFFISRHHRQRQGQDPRHGFLPVSPVPAANPHLWTPSTTSRTRSKTQIPAGLAISGHRRHCQVNRNYRLMVRLSSEFFFTFSNYLHDPRHRYPPISGEPVISGHR